jgi:hypothetical protein
MAKTSSNSAAKAPKAAKKTPAKTSRAKNSSVDLIEKTSEEVLDKLKALDIEQDLQNDLEWCLGSYRADRNPVGLFTMAERALGVLRKEKEKKTKGITAKVITDLEKVLQNR